MQTLLLDVEQWDLVSDLSNNIAVASDPYSQAQDAASEIRTPKGTVYYDSTIGVMNFFGTRPPLALLKASLVAAAMRVPGVTAAIVFISSIVDRIVSGQVQITNETGDNLPAGF